MTDNHWSYTKSNDQSPRVIANARRHTQTDQTPLPLAERQSRDDSTGPCRPNGPTSQVFTSNQRTQRTLWHHGSTPTTTNGATTPSEATHPSPAVTNLTAEYN